jgi:L-glyceraldehyde 3-phosphate reductase
MGALASAVQAGKALYVGLSNYDGPTLEKATAILSREHVPFVINQNRYSIFDRSVEENGLLAMGAKLKKGLICFSPLAQGLLSDRYLNGIPEDSRIRTSGVFLKESALTETKLAQIKALNELALARGQSLAQMALAWDLSHPEVTSVLIGASKPSQIEENVLCLKNLVFSKEERAAIDKIVLS